MKLAEGQTVEQYFEALREGMNDKFRVTIEFKNRLCGGIPAMNESDPEKGRSMIRAWLKGRLPEDTTEDALNAAVEKTIEELVDDAEEEITQTFKADDTGIYVEGRQVKAMIKEVGSRLGFGKPVKGKRPSLKQELHEACHVDEDRIYILRDGQPMPQPDGHEETCIHVMTAQGPRSALKKTGYVEPGATITFTVRILKCVVLSESELEQVLAHGMDQALGAQRSQGFGKFKVVGWEAA